MNGFRITFSVIFYVIGTAVDAASHGISQYSGGVVLYQLGYTGLMLLIEVLVADTTTLRDRLLGSIWPATPFIINTWVNGNITQSVLAGVRSSLSWIHDSGQ